MRSLLIWLFIILVACIPVRGLAPESRGELVRLSVCSLERRDVTSCLITENCMGNAYAMLEARGVFI